MQPRQITVRRVFWLAVFLVGSAVMWVAVARKSDSVTLADGLKCVEISDSAGVDLIEKALEKSGRGDDAIVLRASWLARRQRYNQALERLPDRLLTGPHRRQVLKLVGECLFRTGQLRQAEIALTTLATEFPDEVEAYRLLAVLYYDLGSNQLALTALARVQKLAPDDYRPYHLAGLIQVDGENFGLANEEFRQALQRNPPGDIEVAIRMELVRSLVRILNYRAAIDVLEDLRPSVERSALLAECQWALGSKEQAAALIEETLQTTAPSNKSYLALLRVRARVLEDAGKTDQAVETLNEILIAEPYDVESRYLLVQLLGSSDRAEERDRQQAEYARYRALQDRLVELNLAASADPDALAPRLELIQVCRDLGRVELAEMWRRAADFCEQRLKLKKPPIAESLAQ